VSGAVSQPPLDDLGHHPCRRSTAKPELDRQKAGGARLPDRQFLQVSVALRALRGKPLPTNEAIARRHAQFSDSVGDGGTHEAWQAAPNRLISRCNQLYGDFQSSAYGGVKVAYIYPTSSSSLAVHEGYTPKYQHLSRTVPTCRTMAANRGGYCAA
jgi:hypothetical protein